MESNKNKMSKGLQNLLNDDDDEDEDEDFFKKANKKYGQKDQEQ